MTDRMGPRRVDAPPRGRLFQERMAAPSQRFWMLVACSLVNLTTWEKAEEVHARLRTFYTIRLMAGASPMLEELLRPLGLWRRRAVTLRAMANAWLLRRPRTYDDVLALPGCGKYAADSWAIFVEGRTDVDPDDGKLNWYLDQLKKERRNDDTRGRGHRRAARAADAAGADGGAGRAVQRRRRGRARPAKP